MQTPQNPVLPWDIPTLLDLWNLDRARPRARTPGTLPYAAANSGTAPPTDCMRIPRLSIIPQLSQLRSLQAMASDDGPIGILSAMPQEVAKLQEHVTDQQVRLACGTVAALASATDSVRCPAQEHKFGIFSFTTGTLEGKKVVFAFSNIGMTFCASVVRCAPSHSRRRLSVPPNATRPLCATPYAARL